MMEFLYGIDVGIFRFLNGTIQNPIFDILMPFLTDLNKQPVVLIMVAVALVWLSIQGGATGRMAATLLVVTIVFSDQLNSSLIKHLFDRLRPCHVLENVHLLVSCGSGYSFPSSHAVNNVAGATVLAFYYPKWTWAFASFAGLVAFSRIYVGVHYPSDVFAGAVVGFGCGWIVLTIVRQAERLWKKWKMEGTSS